MSTILIDFQQSDQFDWWDFPNFPRPPAAPRLPAMSKPVKSLSIRTHFGG